MKQVCVVNPDSFLETPEGRVFTPERSKAAWTASFAAFAQGLAEMAAAAPRVLIVCGLQGAGKSRWIERHAAHYEPCICFDAALPGARHRLPIIDIARQHGAPVIAIWIDVPLNVAKARNAGRSPDKQVPEFALESVANLFEAPTVEEGFSEVVRVQD